MGGEVDLFYGSVVFYRDLLLQVSPLSSLFLIFLSASLPPSPYFPHFLMWLVGRDGREVDRL